MSLKLSSADLLHLRPWRRAVEEPQHPSYVRHVDGEWLTVTARDHLGRLVKVARGLMASGIEAGDRVAIMSSTRYSWVLLDEAIWSAGAITVPVYPSSSESQLAWIVEDSGAKILVTESAEQAALAADLDVEVLVLDDGALETLGERGFAVEDQDLHRRRDGVTIGAPASIVYTSGTTGRPRGVVLTHRNLAAEVAGILAAPIGTEAVEGRRLLMFLPMAHVLARAVTHAGAQGGMTVGFWREFSTLTTALTSFQPHIVLGVPRVFEKVHDAIRSSAEEGGRASAEVFRRGSQVAIEWSRDLGGDGLGDARIRGPRLRAEHALFDRLLYSKIREALGGECCYAISGGGALDPRLQHFFRGAGVPIYEGYGLTETSAAITVNGAGAQRIGTVGQPLPGNEVRIAEDGEIQLRGPVVMERFWDNEEATAEVFDQGWLRTGDLGRLDDDGYLTISGRAKEIIVTAGGKNVVPGPIEEELRAHPLIAHAMVVGDGRPFVAALITLDPDGVRRWADERGRGEVDLHDLEQDEELRVEIQQVVDAANQAVSRAEGVRRFELLADDFTEERGELTATLKMRRHVIEQTRGEAMRSIYG